MQEANGGLPADTLTTFEPQADGSLKPVQSWTAGGMMPRTFSFNLKGNMIAVGTNQSIVIMARDVKTGELGQTLSRDELGAAVTNIVWDEDDDSESYGIPLFIGERNVY